VSGALLLARPQESVRAVGLAALLVAAAAGAFARTPVERALDAQDRAALEQLASAAGAAAQSKPGDAAVQYAAALAQSTLAQLALELGDKALGKSAGEAGIRAAQRAVELKPAEAEYHRILGTLCGQVIPANVLAGLKWGRCAMDEVNKAVELAPKSALAWLSRGVGNYYLPAMFGGGVEKAIADLEKAAQLDPKLADAHLWLGIALRKAGRNAEARKAIERSLQLNPDRKWARQQLEKTPAK
jgi:Flp pilus assembly protein TadD